MAEFYPLFVVGAVIGTFTLVFVIAYALMKNKKESIGFDRNMKDSEIIVRLLKYARPHWASFLLALVIMLLSISYDIIAPIIVGDIEKLVVEDFELSTLFLKVAAYAGDHTPENGTENTFFPPSGSLYSYREPLS